MTNTDTTILEWHAEGVGPGGIANVLEALGLGKWSAEGVRAALKRLGIKAMFTPGEEGTAEDYEAEGWEDHGGEKFIRPWLDRVGHDVRDTGCAGEQSDLGGGDVGHHLRRSRPGAPGAAREGRSGKSLGVYGLGVRDKS